MITNETNIENLIKIIKSNIKDRFLVLHVGEDSELNISKLISALNEIEVKFIGGVFPKIIHNDSLYSDSIYLSFISNVVDAYTFKDLSDNNINVPRSIIKDYKSYTYYTLLDGLSSGIIDYLSQVYNTYGIDVNYLGAGAGFLSLTNKECVFSNHGFFKDAAVSILMEANSSIGVKHGWDNISDPLIVTKAEGNSIEKINWKPAFSVYKDIVQKHSGKQISKSNFFDLAKCYPFGLSKENEELVVRDPIIVDDNDAIMCVGDVNENTFVTVLNGKKENLILAAGEAVEEAVNSSLTFETISYSLMIDCISRYLFLEEEFEKELEVVNNLIKSNFPNLELYGVLSLGEISAYGNGFIELFNKTIVISLFEDDK